MREKESVTSLSPAALHHLHLGSFLFHHPHRLNKTTPWHIWNGSAVNKRRKIVVVLLCRFIMWWTIVIGAKFTKRSGFPVTNLLLNKSEYFYWEDAAVGNVWFSSAVDVPSTLQIVSAFSSKKPGVPGNTGVVTSMLVGEKMVSPG